MFWYLSHAACKSEQMIRYLIGYAKTILLGYYFPVL